MDEEGQKQMFSFLPAFTNMVVYIYICIRIAHQKHVL
jgi:hypothetical protein